MDVNEEFGNDIEENDSFDGDLNSDDSNDSEDEENNEIIDKLTLQTEENPYLYDAHIQLIQHLGKKGDLDKLRAARNRMSELFPLTEDLWLDWIRDETNLAFSSEEKLKIIDLFEKSVKDYLSVSLWIEYGQFCIGLMNELDGGIEKCRDVFERGITSVGLHVTKGSLLWETFREFELAILDSLKPSEEEFFSSEEHQAEYNKQKLKILTLFKRQLSVPLLNMNETYKELQKFEGSVDSNIELGYNKASTKFSKIKSYEEALVNDEPPRLSSYQVYLDFEIAENEPSRIQCLFERAIVENCLSVEMWRKYTDYLSSKLNISNVIIPVYERAIRNCPWSVEIWQGYIRALEKHSHSDEEIKSVAEKALSSGFSTATELISLWLTYLEYLKRKIDWNGDHEEDLQVMRSAFERAHSYIIDNFGSDGDPQCELMQFWARIEARFCKNMEKTRHLWNEIMQLGHAKSASMWREYYYIERLYGDAKHTRKLLARALQSSSDWPESIGDLWINFERDEGDLHQLETAVSRFSARMTVINEQRQKAEEKAKSMELSPKRNSLKKNDERERKGVKRKGEPLKDVVTRKKVDSDGFTIPPPKLSKEESKSVQHKKIDVSNKPESSLRHIHDSSKDERTVFLSNLSYDVQEEELRKIFSKVGEITELRLVKDFKGRSKGYAYVEFSSYELANNALQCDRTLVNGRPLYVSKCEDKKSSGIPKEFKYPTELEKKKLFIRNLPFSITEEELRAAFQVHGELKDVRLVTYKNGHSKGIAYVEYKTETDATTALLKTDGLTMGSQTISVALSNPPQRKITKDNSHSLGSSSFGGVEHEVKLRNHARTKLAFVPRSINKLSNKKVDSKSSSEEVQEVEKTKPLSNDDFRNFLLK